ncbi:MAG TPA: hypothetical protein VMV29_04020 [Ktedonobacterales bacterium]|nr:hypothetical protein [Ktedonobacterales bacterium]
MQEPAFQQTVTSVDELEAILGLPGETARRKQIDQLDEHYTWPARDIARERPRLYQH